MRRVVKVESRGGREEEEEGRGDGRGDGGGEERIPD